ncbi:MAG TPA: sugar phosphate nucleotidyltransferase, partial [Erysipelothrix sp.]|nr:sugar phosphate nucleotidyltransferase [Erysipelothrix sp.]
KEGTMMDFGKHVIPSYLENKEEVYAYSHEGYWKDVGTIDSLWETNMEFIEPDFELDIYDATWPIYTRYKASPPQFIKENAVINHSMVVDGCVIDGKVNNSVISEEVKIDTDAAVENSVIMSRAQIGKNAQVKYAIVGESAIVEDNAKVIGDENNIVVVGYEEVVKQ